MAGLSRSEPEKKSTGGWNNALFTSTDGDPLHSGRRFSVCITRIALILLKICSKLGRRKFYNYKNPYMDDLPLVSVLTPSWNTGKFLEETLVSIAAQTYPHYEHIVADAASTDGSVAMIEKFARNHPKLRWFSEPDRGYPDGFGKALRLSKGKYIVQCAVTDGFVDEKWIERCVEIMEKDPEISLVWGLTRQKQLDGTMSGIAQSQFQAVPPPQKEKFLYYWLNTAFWFPEGNFCIRRSVLEKCLPVIEEDRTGEKELFLWLNYNFEQQGFLPYFLPVVANYGRIHESSRSQDEIANGLMLKRWLGYSKLMHDYRRDLLCRRKKHVYRDGNGNPLPYQFSRREYFRMAFSWRVVKWSTKQKMKAWTKETLIQLAKRNLLPGFARRALIRRFPNMRLLERH
jgi:glycosyltransferase involved in cell wall biosynthesis